MISFIERLRQHQLPPEQSLKIVPPLHLLVSEALALEKDVWGERTFVSRLVVAVKKEEIQLKTGWSLSEDRPEVSLAVRIFRFEALKPEELAFFLIASEEWVKKASGSSGQEKCRCLEELYAHLKIALGMIDKLRAQGLSVLNQAELCAKIPPQK